MKRSLLFLLAICFIAGSSVNAQGLLKKVSKSMTDELLGKPATGSNKKSNQPEPPCACDKAEVVMDLGGKMQLDYTELSLSISDDGRILAKDLHVDNYYIVENGKTIGPLKPGDKRLKGFESVMNNETSPDTDSDSDSQKNPWEGNRYITKSGDKFLINFAGKSYGPYALISGFAVPKSGDKFAALVTENLVANEAQSKQMEEAMKNAKTDQEKMDLAMKYGQEMQQRMMQGGGPQSMMIKMISNIPEATYDPMNSANGTLNGNVKFDDIILVCYDKIVDLQGKTLFQIKPEAFGAEKLYLNSSNTKYAYYNSGTLFFSDNTTMAELFNPYLVKADGKVFLTYMYYSPKNIAIMQCKIPF
jgi:hypothetical protein